MRTSITSLLSLTAGLPCSNAAFYYGVIQVNAPNWLAPKAVTATGSDLVSTQLVCGDIGKETNGGTTVTPVCKDGGMSINPSGTGSFSSSNCGFNKETLYTRLNGNQLQIAKDESFNTLVANCDAKSDCTSQTGTSKFCSLGAGFGGGLVYVPYWICHDADGYTSACHND